MFQYKLCRKGFVIRRAAVTLRYVSTMRMYWLYNWTCCRSMTPRESEKPGRMYFTAVIFSLPVSKRLSFLLISSSDGSYMSLYTATQKTASQNVFVTSLTNLDFDHPAHSIATPVCKKSHEIQNARVKLWQTYSRHRVPNFVRTGRVL